MDGIQLDRPAVARARRQHPVLVFPDVDLDQVIAGAAAASSRNGGPRFAQRFLVSRESARPSPRRSLPQSADLHVGPGLKPPRSGPAHQRPAARPRGSAGCRRP